MGKRVQGAALRAKKRQKALLEELQEQQAEAVAQQPAADKTNEELFVLDTTGDTVPRQQRPAAKKEKKSKKETVWSDRDKQEMEKLMQRHSKEQLAAMAEKGRKMLDKSNHLKTHGIRKAKAQSQQVDLWGAGKTDNTTTAAVTKTTEKTTTNDKVAQPEEEVRDNTETLLPGTVNIGEKPAGGISKPLIAPPPPVTPSSKNRAKMKGIAVDVAKSGQSYRPDPKEHERVLQEAVAVEERRNAAEMEKKAPISSGMSEATKAFILGDSDSSSDEDESDLEDTELAPSKFHKQKEKVSKSKRNKQKRARHEERERLEAKKKRKLENLVFQLPRFKKELKKRQEVNKEIKEKKQKRDQERVEGAGTQIEKVLSEQDPLAAPTVPVALPSEVKRKEGSLRTIVPKGDLVTDRMASFALRNLAPRLPSQAAAHRERMSRKRRRSKIKVKGGKDWRGDDFVIIK